MFTRRAWLMASGTALATATAMLPLAAQAQETTYPVDSIRIIVPFGAGGGTDAVARMVAVGLSERLGITVNVENRPGAAGVIGSTEVAQGSTDGSIIGLLTSSLDSYEVLGRGAITYQSFAPVALVNFDPAGVQVSSSSPFENLQQLVDAVKSDPQAYTASASGIGGPWHIAWISLLQAVEVAPDAVIFIPSEGAGPSLNELIAGAVDFVPSSVAEARALIDAGDVKSLAIMSNERLEAFPDVPTVEEAIGIPVTSGVWRGFAGPAGMDPAAVEILSTQIEDIYRSEAFIKQMSDLGYGLRWAEGDEFAEFMAAAYDSTAEVLKAAGLAQ